MVPQQHTQDTLNVTPQSPSSAGPIESATTNLNTLNTPARRRNSNRIDMDTSPCDDFLASSSLQMDNGKYIVNSILFGSQRVDVNSRTPYSDATQTKKHSPNHIKRPMNSFMVFSQIKRKEICEKTPEVHNAEISKRLGAEWRKLSEEERKPYMLEAEMLRKLHVKEYPNYKYRPQKKHSKASKTTSSSPSSGETNNNSPNSPSSSSCSPLQYNQQNTSSESEAPSPSTSGKTTANSRRTKRNRITTNGSGTSNKRHKNDTNNNTTNKSAPYQFHQILEEPLHQQQDPHYHHHNHHQDVFNHNENSADKLIIKDEMDDLFSDDLPPDSSLVGYGLENCSEFDDKSTIVKDANLNTASLQTKLPAASTFNNLRHPPSIYQHPDMDHLLSSNIHLQHNSSLHPQHQQQHNLFTISELTNPNYIQQQQHQHNNTNQPNNNNDTLFCLGQPTVTMNVNVAKVDDYYRSSVTDESDCSMLNSDVASPQEVGGFSSNGSNIADNSIFPDDYTMIYEMAQEGIDFPDTSFMDTLIIPNT